MYPSLFASKNTRAPPPGLVPKFAPVVMSVYDGNGLTSFVINVATELRTEYVLVPEKMYMIMMAHLHLLELHLEQATMKRH